MSDEDCLYLSPYGLVKGRKPATGGVYFGPAGNPGALPGEAPAIGRSYPEQPSAIAPLPPDELEFLRAIAVPDPPVRAAIPVTPTPVERAASDHAVPIVRPPRREDSARGHTGRRRNQWAVSAISCLLVAGIGWHFTSGPRACVLPEGSAAQMAAASVAGNIVTAESDGDSSAKNPRSTATGAGQFLKGTWLDMIRAYRPDLNGRSETDLLDMRRDASLARQMVARFAEANAAMLGSRCLPVTPGTLYLAHFAGGGGAVAVLSAPDHADAAETMAQGDASKRTTRDMIVTANPFLARFTVADLKDWAERKMRTAGRLSRM